MTGTDGRNIVVIEDEDAIRDIVAYNLERAGFEVATAGNGRDGLQLVRDLLPGLVLLDLMLPELDGIEVCRRLRSDPATARIPVIMLTAKGDEGEIVEGLEAGADDYVTKPFSPRELVARVQANLRRVELGGDDTVAVATGAAAAAGAGDDGLDVDHELAADPERRRVQVGDVVVDPDRHEVLVAGTDVRFTRTELRLLHVLLRKPGRVYTREQLVERVMGDNAWVTDRTIDVHVRAIRRKLGEHADAIETIRGVGYRGRDAVERA
jgi:two-component system phosphate regulon response regulator PhoB